MCFGKAWPLKHKHSLLKNSEWKKDKERRGTAVKKKIKKKDKLTETERKSGPQVLWRLAPANPKPTKNEIGGESNGEEGVEGLMKTMWMKAIFNNERASGFCGAW